MTVVETLCRISLATPVVWRLTRMVSSAYAATGRVDFGGVEGLPLLVPEEVLGSRVMDCLYWIGLLMSAQTALWVVCGFAAVLLVGLAFAGIARLNRRIRFAPRTARHASSSAALRPAEQGTGGAQLCR